MDAVASALGSLLAGLPGLGVFLLRCGLVLAALVAGAFLLRRTRPLSVLRRAIDGILSAVVTIALLAMVLLSSLQIILRNVFDSGLLWIDPLLRHLVLVVAFAGALIATGRKRHIQINVLGRLLRGGARRAVGALIAALAATVSLGLCHAAATLLRDELEFGEVVFLGIPSWVVVTAFPVAFAALALRFAYLVCLELAGEAPQAEEIPLEAEFDGEFGDEPQDAVGTGAGGAA